MPKYLIQASYTAEGVQGLLKDGGSKRRAAAEQAIKGLGGRLEAFYFAFGDTDVFAIADAPDNMSAAAVSLGRDRQRRRARQDNGSYDPGGNGSGDTEERELPSPRKVTRRFVDTASVEPPSALVVSLGLRHWDGNLLSGLYMAKVTDS